MPAHSLAAAASPAHSAPTWLRYCCPLCQGALLALTEAYRCEGCRRNYPVVWGIPDFRVSPDPYIGIPEDHEKGLKLAARYAATDFKGLLELYWSLTPETPPALAQEYMRHDLAGVARGRSALAAIAAQSPPMPPEARLLEVGTRTGGFLVAAAASRSGVARAPSPATFPAEGGGATYLVGCDIAFRWLVVARKRLEEAGAVADLVCCGGEYLPFPGGQFDYVIAGNVLEHAADQEHVVHEACRVLAPGGRLFATTWNRFSLAPEPHVRLWGVGFLPRRWMNSYVRWRRRADYSHVRLLSLLELRRMVRRVAFQTCRIDLPLFSADELVGLSCGKRLLARLYQCVRGWPLVRQVLLLLGPGWQVTCTRVARAPSPAAFPAEAFGSESRVRDRRGGGAT